MCGHAVGKIGDHEWQFRQAPGKAAGGKPCAGTEIEGGSRHGTSLRDQTHQLLGHFFLHVSVAVVFGGLAREVPPDPGRIDGVAGHERNSLQQAATG